MNERGAFPYKTSLSEANINEWGVQNRPTKKNGFLLLTTLF